MSQNSTVFNLWWGFSPVTTNWLTDYPFIWAIPNTTILISFPSKVVVDTNETQFLFFATKQGVFYFRVLSNFSNFAFSPLAHRAIAHSVCLVKDTNSEPHPWAPPPLPRPRTPHHTHVFSSALPFPSLPFPDCCSIPSRNSKQRDSSRSLRVRKGRNLYI